MSSTKNIAWLAYCFLGLVWGSNFIFMKWAAEYITPAQVTCLRVVFGFLPISLFALTRGDLSWAHFRHARHFFVMALLACAFYYFAFAKGTSLLPSSVAGMLSGAIPLFTFACAFFALREERITPTKAMGVLLGFIGVLLIARPWSAEGTTDIKGVAWMIAGALSLGFSFVYARKFVSPLKLPAAALATYQMGIAMLVLALVTPISGTSAVFADTRAWLALVLGLGLCGTGLAYLAYYHIVEKLGALAASSVTYIPPVVALLIGVLLVGEQIAPIGYFAMCLILMGVAIVQFGAKLPVQKS